MIRIAIVNHSTVLPADELPPIVRALQVQVGQDVYPAWGVNAILTNYVTQPPPASDWVLGIFDDADQAGALGYHDVTPAGLPVGKVFAKTTLDNGGKISTVVSHELVEMLLDPSINLLVQDVHHPARFWCMEIADAVEADDDGYMVRGVLMSDFVLPAYFQPWLDVAGPFDLRRRLRGPVPALSPGGYMAYVEGGVWGQVFGRQRARQQTGTPGGSGRLLRRQHEPLRSTFEVESP